MRSMMLYTISMTPKTLRIDTMQDALALLQWYADAGVDEAMEDAPADYYAFTQADAKPKPRPAATATTAAEKSVAQPAQAPAASLAPRAAAPAPLAKATASIIEEARAAAESCTTVAELKAAIEAFEGHPLKKLASNTVFADGNPQASIMCLGDAPGADDDKQGLPFCGVEGQLLDKMFAAIGHSRETTLYLSNTVFWRPPGNRPPSPEELEICRPFVEKHIALVKPKLLLLVGGVAATSMLNVTTGITRLRGRAHQYTHPQLDSAIETHVLFHPSYLLSQPARKALAWRDLLQIKQSVEKIT